MRFINESFKRTQALRKLVKFVADLSPMSEMAGLVVKDTEGDSTGHGIAWPTAPERVGPAPSLVVVWVPTPQSHYPYRLDTPAEVGPIVCANWQEEFVFILAHEVRHVRSFWDQSLWPVGMSQEELSVWAETDADLFAAKILRLFRASTLGASQIRITESSSYSLDNHQGVACTPSKSRSVSTTPSFFVSSASAPAP